MKFRAIVLTVLILALAGLGFLFYQNQAYLESINQANEERDKQEKLDKKQNDLVAVQKELELLKAQLRFSQTPGASAANPQPVDANAAASVSDNEEIRELRAKLAKLEQDKHVAQQEAEILASKDAEKRDKNLEVANQVDNARVVGKVLTYDKASNLLIFSPVGQPSLANGQELAIRRKSGIFAYLTVDEIDQVSGTYSATVKMDEYFKIGIDVADPIAEGEDIIIPPAILQHEEPPATNTEDAAPSAPAALDPIPWVED